MMKKLYFLIGLVAVTIPSIASSYEFPKKIFNIHLYDNVYKYLEENEINKELSLAPDVAYENYHSFWLDGAKKIKKNENFDTYLGLIKKNDDDNKIIYIGGFKEEEFYIPSKNSFEKFKISCFSIRASILKIVKFKYGIKNKNLIRKILSSRPESSKITLVDVTRIESKSGKEILSFLCFFSTRDDYYFSRSLFALSSKDDLFIMNDRIDLLIETNLKAIDFDLLKYDGSGL